MQMLKRLLVTATLMAAMTALPAAAAGADPIKDCTTGACACGQEVSVGYPGKDPVYTLRMDC
jgi:hypothetical protein